MNEDKKSFLEQRLLLELSEIERQIKDLEGERQALRRLLMRAQRDDLLTHQVMRKNSVGRVLIETKVLNTLRAAKAPVEASKLYRAVQTIDGNLKKNTFRSHLHRMKERGAIVNPIGLRGVWKLAPDAEKKASKGGGIRKRFTGNS